MDKSFHAQVQFLVFAHVYVDAKTEEEARQKIQRGGGFLSGCIEFQDHTAETQEIELITERE